MPLTDNNSPGPIEDERLPRGADHKTRVAIWVILLGLINFGVFTVVYTFIGGEAVHGDVQRDAAGELHYLLRGYDQDVVEVSRATFIYSAVHSITIWPTVGAVMLAMLTLAKDRIVSAMHSTVVRGRTFITIMATIIVIFLVFTTVLFIARFLHKLASPSPVAAILSAVGVA